jgi:hypothetical protein
VKAPRGLTHARKLYAPETWIERTAAGWHELGGRRAVLLVQLPPGHARDAAHPDDEVLGAGWVIFMLAASRARLRLVAVTDGEGFNRGHADPGELARQRTVETAAGMRALVLRQPR